MKYIFLLFLAMYVNSVRGDTTITGLPALGPASVGVNDVFPFVNISLNETAKFKISDLLTVPSLQNPSFATITVGSITAGSFSISSSAVLPYLTQGSVLFAGGGGAIAQNNSNIFWDNTNNRLGIGLATPSAPLHIAGDPSATTGPIRLQSASTSAGAAVEGYRSQGTIASPSMATSGQDTIKLHGYGYDGVQFTKSGVLAFSVQSSVSTGIVPSQFKVSTMDTSGNLNTVLSAADTGAIILGASTQTPAHNLYGSLGFSGSSSGVVTLKTQAVAGTYNLNFPISAGTSGQFLTSGGGGSSPMTWSNGYISPTIQKFSVSTSSGVYTLPTPAPLYLKVTMVGGGAGGAGSGSSGAGAGGNGGITTFSVMTCNGGTGSSAGPNTPGGAGGTATLGSGPIGIALTGGSGTGSGSSISTLGEAGGPGAPSALGGGGGGGAENAAGLSAAANSGGGGGGGGGNSTGTSFPGAGSGAGGYISALITGSLASSYNFSVGTAGSLGTAGSSGQAGGSGSVGMVLVEEHYQ